jgi:predicted PurR-regulated permease PerM
MLTMASSRWRTPVPWMLLGAALLSIATLWPFAATIGAGLVFGYVSERPIDWVLRKLRKSSERWRTAVALGWITFVLLVVAMPVTGALWVAAQELFAWVVSADFQEISALPLAAVEWIRAKTAVHGVVLSHEELEARMRALVAGSAGWLVQRSGTALSATPGAVFDLFLGTLAWLTFAVHGPSIRERVLPVLLPWKRERELLRRVTADVVNGVVVANVLVSASQALLITLALAIFRVPHAFVWGVASFFVSFVPVVGTAVITLGAAAWLLAHERVGAAVGMGVVALLAGSFDNFLRPLFMQGSMKLPFLWLLVAFLGGFAAFGVGGVMLGPLAFAWFRELFRVFSEDAASASAPSADEALSPPPPPESET